MYKNKIIPVAKLAYGFNKPQRIKIKNWENKIESLARDFGLSSRAEEVIEKAKQNSKPNESDIRLYEKARMYLIQML